jgi:hypothetical protein
VRYERTAVWLIDWLSVLWLIMKAPHGYKGQRYLQYIFKFMQNPTRNLINARTNMIKKWQSSYAKSRSLG